MKKVYTISVQLLSAMHINAGVAPDSKRIFVKSNGVPFIPATLMKGIVRGNFNMLINTFAPEKSYIVDTLFGSEGYNRSHIIFDNLITDQPLEYENRANISINRYTKKVNDKALVFSEVVSRSDKNSNPVIFKGDVIFCCNKETILYEKYLIESVRLINSIGSGKSRGLGFSEVNINEKTC